jgi:hypothetical protein
VAGPRILSVALLAPLLLLSGCNREHKATPPPPSITTTTAPAPLKLAAAAIDVHSMRTEPTPLPDAVRDQVLATLDTYVAAAVLDPLLTGVPPVGLDSVFTPVALARLAPGTPDRAALVEDTRPAPGTVAPEKTGVVLSALAAEDGAIGMVSASIDIALLFTMPTGALRIGRTGELVLVPVPGGWRIDSYDVVTKRDSAPPPPATTTTARRKK